MKYRYGGYWDLQYDMMIDEYGKRLTIDTSIEAEKRYLRSRVSAFNKTIARVSYDSRMRLMAKEMQAETQLKLDILEAKEEIWRHLY